MSQVAMPTGADMEAAHEILAIIDNISRGYYPGDRDGYTAAHLPFSPANPDHLRALYDKLKASINKAPAGLHRVVWGFDMLIQTDILDASTPTVELHPRIGRALAHMAVLDKVNHSPPSRIRRCWTCCDVCHSEHKSRFGARLHWIWLRVIGRAQPK